MSLSCLRIGTLKYALFKSIAQKISGYQTDCPSRNEDLGSDKILKQMSRCDCGSPHKHGFFQLVCGTTWRQLEYGKSFPEICHLLAIRRAANQQFLNFWRIASQLTFHNFAISTNCAHARFHVVCANIYEEG